jgi:hypothetical protein
VGDDIHNDIEMMCMCVFVCARMNLRSNICSNVYLYDYVNVIIPTITENEYKMHTSKLDKCYANVQCTYS